jgi:hypothetical protein
MDRECKVGDVISSNFLPLGKYVVTHNDSIVNYCDTKEGKGFHANYVAIRLLDNDGNYCPEAPKLSFLQNAKLYEGKGKVKTKRKIIDRKDIVLHATMKRIDWFVFEKTP